MRQLYAGLLLLWPTVVYAQSSPNLGYGDQPTPAQWNSYFAAKQDYLGFTPLNGKSLNGYVYCNFQPGCSASTTIPTNVLTGYLPSASFPALSGDVTSSPGSTNTILATVNANTGSWGSTTKIPVVTVNGKGLVTAVSTVTPAISGTMFTGLTNNLPLIGNSMGQIVQGTVSGNTTIFGTVAGSPVSGNCVQFDSNHNLVDAGGVCTTGGGGGTVTSSTANYMAYYAATGTAVTGLSTANNGVLITGGSGIPAISSTLPTAVQTNIIGTGALASGSTVAGFDVTYDSMNDYQQFATTSFIMSNFGGL